MYCELIFALVVLLIDIWGVSFQEKTRKLAVFNYQKKQII
jgi:hypothetical protein